MSYTRSSSPAKRRQQRFDRLSPGVQRLLTAPGMAQTMVATAPIVRQMLAAGFSPTPGMGLPEFNACVSIVEDMLGLSPLSDEEFERALRLSIPPEYREALQ
jgi:hypothetical protein